MPGSSCGWSKRPTPGQAEEAETLRDRLLAADPADCPRILGAFVDFWPARQAAPFPVGDPALDWANGRLPVGQSRKEAAWR